MKQLERVVTFIARWTALLGGLALVLLTLVTVASVSGRALSTMANLHDSDSWLMPIYPALRSIGSFFAGLGARPIPGDFELVEAGTGFAIFAFLPWCHLKRGHATVELLATWFPARMNRLIDLVADFLMFGAASLIAWRHWLGTLDKVSYGEITFILQFPLWWAYAASMLGASVFVLVAAFGLLRSMSELKNGASAKRMGAVH
ncbi:MAG: TRAP transporter small permease [Nitratireductor sp.]|nr:TRAP transporter small permease [Nitratireductor sp.]